MNLQAVILAGGSGDLNHLPCKIILTIDLPVAVAWSRLRPVIGLEHSRLNPKLQPLILSFNLWLSSGGCFNLSKDSFCDFIGDDF
ncbi:hypothetical protein C1752_00647 [Acaryochloris thomasi RCC1774]|uniref:Uncharacterized protein n=1 Tax=Acaryochloris thomasi RCC1774 TaxID=1764569 RepID=A0A2W1JX47_9CYAN|nr:hypothetical protein C1752_00647 [Acaryochloris thomasi RCC1774]